MASERPLGVILAGGLARRLGGIDKAFIEIGNRTILQRTIDCVRPQCLDVAVNANGDAARFASFGLPVVADDIPGFAGPLAGILAGLDWAASRHPETEYVVSVPGDCPFLPDNLVSKLETARTKGAANLACAVSGGRRHPVVGLWPVSLRNDLRKALLDEGLRKVEAWAARYGAATAEWPDQPFDPFLNVNTAEDVARAQTLAAGFPSA